MGQLNLSFLQVEVEITNPWGLFAHRAHIFLLLFPVEMCS